MENGIAKKFTGMLLAGVVALGVAARDARAAAGTNKYAVCVGINKYADISSLSGCVNDSVYMEETLVAGGWPSANVTRLNDSKATKNAIRRAISNVAAKAVSGDTFVFMQSSHGGQFNADPNDPDAPAITGNSGKAVFLCVYDEDYYNNKTAYNDYELAKDLASFRSGVKVVVIVDACHSGGLFKSASKAKSAAASFDLAERVTELMDDTRAVRKARGERVEKGLSSSEIGWATAAEYYEYSRDGGFYHTDKWLTDASYGDEYWNARFQEYRYPSHYKSGGVFLTSATWGLWKGTADGNATVGNGDGYCDAYEFWRSGYEFCVQLGSFWGNSSYTFHPQCLNTGVLRSVKLWKNGTSTLSLGGSERTFSSAATTSKELAVTANVSWTANSSVSWLTLKTASGKKSGKIVYDVAANSGTGARKGKITVAGGGKTATYSVTQNGIVVKLELGGSERTFSSAAASSKELGVSASVSWTAKSSVSWLTLKTTGGKGNGTIVYNVAANSGSGTRTGKITVSGGGKTATYTVKQTGSGSVELSLGGSERTFTSAAASGKELPVTANVSWTAKSSVSWLTLKTTGGKGNGKITYNVAANSGSGTRTGKITVSGGGKTAAYTVKQTGSGTVELSLGGSERTFTSSAASGKELPVTANVSWTAKSSVSWLTLKTTGGTGNGKITYSVAANKGTGSRTGKITVSGGGKTATYTVKQSGTAETELSLGGSSRTFSSSAASGKEVSVTATMSWTARSSVPWLTLGTTDGTGSGTITYNVSANSGPWTRTGTIVVTGGGLTATYTVTQNGTGENELSLGSSSRTFSSSAASGKELSVTANVSWTARSSVPWLTLKTTGGTGNGTITYNVSANSETWTRTGTIVVTGGGLAATFTVTQSGTGGNELSLGSSERTFSSSAASGKELSVTANVSWTARSTVPWLTLQTTGGTGNGKITYSVAENSAFGARTGAIVVAGGGLAATFTVTQDGTNGKTTASLSFAAGGGTKTATFALSTTSIRTGAITASANWLSAHTTITTSGGEGTIGIVVTASANTSGGSRSGTVTLNATGGPYKVTVTQAGKKSKSAEKVEGRVWVTTSDGRPGDAVADGDEETGWTPEGTDGAWVALTFEEARSVGSVVVKGEALPEGMRVLVSEDGDDWSEEGCEAASYLWVILPDEGETPTVTEIESEP